MKKNNGVPCLFLLGAAGLALTLPLRAQTNNEIFEKMVGPQTKMDPAVVGQVLKDGPGKKVRIDTDGDGRVDTLYFIDADSRHSGTRNPIVVKVVDEDGDMDAAARGTWTAISMSPIGTETGRWTGSWTISTPTATATSTSSFSTSGPSTPTSRRRPRIFTMTAPMP